MKKAKEKENQYYEGIGRRKESVARVRLYVGGKEKTVAIGSLKVKLGEIFVNRNPVEKTFSLPIEQAKYRNPLILTNALERFAITAVIRGGGKNGQLDAFIHGIARALEKVDKETYRPALKKESLLTRDPRAKERRKVGTGGKARRKKQSPKR